MTGPPRPPRVWGALLERAARADDREFVVGDIEEEYTRIAGQRGRAQADRWYRVQALSLAWTRLVGRRRPAGGPESTEPDGRGHMGGNATGGNAMGLETAARDLRYAVRGLASRPGFTLLVVLTLTLGIGANAAMFSVVNAVMLRALPFPDADRLVDVAEAVGQDAAGRIPTSVATWRDWRDGAGSFERLEAYSPFTTQTLTGVDEPLRLVATLSTPGYLPMLGARPLFGRLFLEHEGDGTGNDAPVVVLGHGLWERAFGADPDVVGRTIRLDGDPHTVVGVLEPGFLDFRSGATPTDLYLPLSRLVALQGADAIERRVGRFVFALGRLRADRTLDQARAELESVTAGIRASEPGSMRDSGVVLQPARNLVLGAMDAPLLALLTGAFFLLLVACINVASLLLVRGAARTREMALRLALGAPRGRLVAQLTTEALILALLGGIGGVLLARLTLGALLDLNASALPSWVEPSLDGTVLAVSLLLTLATGLAFGLVPAVRATRTDLRSALGAGATRSGSARSGVGRSALVVVEVATAVLLTVGSGLMLRSFQALVGTDMGFRVHDVLTFRVNLPTASYPTGEDVTGFGRRLVEELEAAPGVQFAALWGPGTPGQAGSYTTLLSEGMEAESQLDAPLTRVHGVTVGALEGMEVPVVAGRAFTTEDRPGSTPTAILSEGLARTLFGNEDPLGRLVHHFLPPSIDPADFPPYEVVGVVADTRLGGRQLSATFDVPHDLYLPWAQRGQRGTRSMVVLMGTSADPTSLAPAAREALAGLDPDLPAYAVQDMGSVVGQELVLARFVAVLMGIFGVLSLFLAALGIYGVLSQSVARRGREIGLRLALGAERGSTALLFVGEAMRLAGLGVAAGLAAALLLTRFVSSLLYGVEAHDPLTLGGAAAVLLLVALAAAFLPTLRATRVHPAVALKGD